MSKLKEKEPYVISLYKSGKTIAEICKLTELSNGSVYKVLNNNNVHLNRKRRYKVNNDFFSIIDTPEKAYILGFILADGHNNIKKRLLSIQLHPKDVDILEKIVIAMESNNPINFYQYGDNKKACLSINNYKICQDLLKLGLTKNKSYNAKLPKVPNNLINYLILGIFDGDGSISIDKTRYNKANFTITGTKDVIFSIVNIIKEECDVNSYVHERHRERNNNNYTLSVSGNIQIIRFMNWLYCDTPIFLNRKHEKYLNLKKIVNDRLTRIKDKEVEKLKILKEKEEMLLMKQETIIKLYNENLSIRQIKNKTGFDRRFISKVLKNNSLEIRDKSSYNDYKLGQIKKYYNK